MTNYAARLHRAVRLKQTPALVGLDPRFDELPAPIVRSARKREARDRQSLMAAAYEEFCFRVIDVVAASCRPSNRSRLFLRSAARKAC